MINLYIAEDQVMLNSALVSLLDLEEDLNILGSALDGETALREINHLAVDVAILDIEMPHMTGLELAHRLKDEKPAVLVIILTTFAKQDYFEQAVEADVKGYLLKDSPTEHLIETIHAVIDGDTVYDPKLVRHVLRAERNPLTPREQEILLKLDQGLATQSIADQLFLSQGTIRNYISSILSKTGAQSRIEALNIARYHGWLNH
ncbi:response regulator [Ignavigranum ruoffiae]|uniref:Two component transcriptional regulator, LuxR family n=1 Tax=Ignavigranum ruoffiae TaxID=89093 RepID=A0A1H9BZV6_9LACT|nr:response regulator transcription factor [Ignavigranum ruoffiae]UPQ86395.1 response regulator transcription factor [Ignavigranum ruoffiae]SEP93918.1 two component transcriptional regulator, LuxR family [Ignavigranum ruoffiae]